jgi:hypothetical protein
MKPILNVHTIEVTAHHEAGHAVMAYHFRNAIREGGVTVNLNQPGNGCCHTRRGVFPEGRDSMRSIGGTVWTHWQRRVEWAIIELLAGPLAEVRYLNRGRSPAGVWVVQELS